MKQVSFYVFMLLFSGIISCSKKSTSHQDMLALLKETEKMAFNPKNQFSPRAKIAFMEAKLNDPQLSAEERTYYEYHRANTLLQLGEEGKAITALEALVQQRNSYLYDALRSLGIAYLRVGERSNCIANHAAESCIIPVKGLGLHRDPEGSEKAIEVYQQLLALDPNDLESRWLLNIAYMTLGQYPAKVPARYFIPHMEGDTTEHVQPFTDIAADVKLDLNTMAGGSIADDFDNDGFLDLVISSQYVPEQIRYFHNNGNGTFSDLTEKAGLTGISGGLNINQADYNNDGFRDVLILRGGWQHDFGNEPNSLLRNNGDGTFTDVTKESGLLSFHPTQTATWNDFNNDGWLDLYIGNETDRDAVNNLHPCELYMSNRDGTFREVAMQAKCNVISYVKGVTSGDYDHDGWKDIFISTMSNERFLLKNMGVVSGNEIEFSNATEQAGVGNEKNNTFPTWFWDYDNDGWLDIFVCDYSFSGESLALYEASEKLNIPAGRPDKTLLYHNNHDGTFTNVASEAGINTNVFAMGSNFGDIDNDGYLDMYFATGNPDYQSLVPNKMFRNLDGKHFAEVTASARVGHLQKGHGVSFADMDNDGDQDIYTKMGGTFPGDAYQSAFFLNPGQGNNHWITVQLEGVNVNRDAVGSTLKVVITENGKRRTIFRDVNTGSSFGNLPLRREIGLGKAARIDTLEVRWHGNGVKPQVFTNINANQCIRITEGEDDIRKIEYKTFTWTLTDKLCGPQQLNP